MRAQTLHQFLENISVIFPTFLVQLAPPNNTASSLQQTFPVSSR